jgi:hypothetical protein
MNLIYDDATLTAFRESQAELLALVERLVAKARAQNLWEDLTCIVVAHSQADLDCAPWWGEGEAEIPDWQWTTRHGGWTELLLPVSNSGFAYHALLPADAAMELQETTEF